ARAALQDVVALAAAHLVVAGPAVQGVVAQVAPDDVGAVVAEQHVVVFAADHPVVAAPAVGGVVALVAVDVVEGAAAVDRVVALAAAQVVGDGGPGDVVVAGPAHNG